MVPYLITSALVLLLLGIAWRRNDILNLFLKCCMLSLSLWGWFMVLLEMGYVVRS